MSTRDTSGPNPAAGPATGQPAGQSIDQKRALARKLLAKKLERPRVAQLSFAQQRLWFLHQLEPDSAYYNIPAAARMRGRLDVAALERSLAEIVRRHESLRTTFAEQDGAPVQVIHPRLPVSLVVEDLGALPAAQREEQALGRARKEARTPFSLARGPLLRATLLRLAADEHLLLLTMHHIVSDGWSSSVLLRELSSLYGALSAGRPSPLPPLPIQYADFARWQRAWLQGSVLEEQLAWWRQHLAGELPVLGLPGDRPRPAVQSFRGATYRRRLPTDLARAVEQLGRREGATPFMVLLAAFQALLARYTGLTDILVGSPIANRNRVETEGLIGFFVNTLVLRGDLSERPSFRALLRRVRESTLGAYAHQDLPFDKLVEALQPDRSLSHAPIFQVMFVLLNTPPPPLTLPGLRVEVMDLDSATAQFDLSLTLHEVDDGLAAAFEYSTDLFDEATVARMADHYATLLHSAASDPDRPVHALPMLGVDEERAALALGRGAHRPAPAACVHTLVHAQAARAPHAIAVVDQPTALTYGELVQRAQHLARHLRGLGVGPEVLVAVRLDRTVDLPVALLGILEAGGAYVCLDPEYPPARLALMLEDTGAPVLITRRALTTATATAQLPPFSGHVLCIDELPETVPAPAERAALGPGPDNLAYVVYTSGSTGTPKGAMVSHRSLVNAYRGWEESYELGSRSRAHLQMASCSFDVFSGDLVRALCSGGRLLLCPRDLLMDPPALLAFMRRHGADSAEFVPAVLRGLVQHLEESDQRLDFMRLVIAGSDAWYTGELQALRRLCGPRTRVINSYGLSEATIDSSFFEDPGSRLAGDGLVPIGRAFANVQLYVLDAHMRPVPRGVVGELYVGGEGVARGYLRQPGLTARRFVPDPFATRPGQRLYRTGDTARVLPDGNVEFLGRQDAQVKIRGFRVEPGEIEAALRSHPLVRQAVVMAREDRPGQKRLVAYLVPASERGSGTSVHSAPGALPPGGEALDELRAFLKARLPAYMVPAAMVVLDELPASPNGKVDRKALPAPPEDAGQADAFVAPRTPTEAAIASVWQELLRVERVGVHDNFFELGGDSILTIQVIARARKLDLALTPRLLLQHQTVAELAAALQQPGRRVHAEQGPVTGPVQPSPIIRWFFAQRLPEPHHWNQAVLVASDRPLEPARLRQAAQHLVRHHDALRLGCVQGPAGWRLDCRGPELAVTLVCHDLSALPAAQRPGALADAATALHAGMRLDDGPLLRLALFDQGPEEPQLLLLAAHHLAVDGVSWRILLEDLDTAYQQLAAGAEVRLPPKTTSFQAWCERLARHAGSQALASERPYWLAVQQAEAPRLPLDFPAAPADNTEGTARAVHVSLTTAHTETLLRELPRTHGGAQLQDALLAACLHAFTRWTGVPALRLELESHGREPGLDATIGDTSAGDATDAPAPMADDVDLSRTVGWFTSVFPLVLRGEHAAGMVELLRAVRRQLGSVPRRGMGHGLLRYLAGDLPDAPAPELSFNYLGQVDAARPEGSCLRLVPQAPGLARSASSPRAFVLELEGMLLDGRLQLSFTYSERLHHRETVERLAADFVEALQVLAAGCRARAAAPSPADFPLAGLEPAALARLLEGAGEVEDIYPLSPLQQGMLFHSLYQHGVGMYVDQLSCRLDGALDLDAFQRAWQEVIDRHPGLRVSLAWEELSQPLQLVHRRPRLPWDVQDWRDLPAAAQQARLDALREAERNRAMPLGAAPLMRFALVRLDAHRHHFVWTHHHILFDGWSMAILLQELFACYEALRQGRQAALPPSRSYREYIAWLQQQDAARAEAFWRRQLAGFRTPTAPLDAPGDRTAAGEGREHTRLLPAETTAALQALSRQLLVPLNNLLQAAWALLLSSYSGQDDVVFGITVSGRPPVLPGVEEMVGLFINTLPLRVRVQPDMRLRDWLQQLQQQQVALSELEHTPLPLTQTWSELPHGVALFETIFVFENHPLHQAVEALQGSLQASEVAMMSRNNYPFSLVAVPGPRLTLHVLYHGQRYSDAAVAQILDHLEQVLAGFVAHPDQRLAALGPGTRMAAAAPAASPAAAPAAAEDAGDELGAFDFEAELATSPDATHGRASS